MSRSVLCSGCGFSNNLPDSAFCQVCGGPLTASASSVEEVSRISGSGFSLQGLVVALVVQGLLTAAVLYGLPAAVPVFDMEGGSGALVCIPVWCAGGFLLGVKWPGRFSSEPVVASILIAAPTVFLLVQGQTVHTMPTFLYGIMGAIGVLFTRVGVHVGELVACRARSKQA